MNYITQLLSVAFLLASSFCSAQCDYMFMSKDTVPFDCKAKIVSSIGHTLNNYDIDNKIVVMQPTCNTSSSYVYSFFRDGVLMDVVTLIRKGDSNEFEVKQTGVGLIRVERI